MWQPLREKGTGEMNASDMIEVLEWTEDLESEEEGDAKFDGEEGKGGNIKAGGREGDETKRR